MTKVISTMFPLNRTKTMADVMHTTKRWLLGSRHYRLSDKNLDGLEQSGFAYENNVCKVETLAYSDDNKSLWSLRHSTGNKSKRYVTEVTARILNNPEVSSEKLVASVSLGFEGIFVPAKISKPLAIQFLINDVGGDYDGSILTVRSQPRYLQKGEEQFIQDLVTRDINKKLPVVYISIGSDGHYPVVPEELIRDLVGEAHVIVEPSRNFSFMLKKLFGHQNPYNGAIGIFFPYKHEIKKGEDILQKRILPYRTDDMHENTVAVARRLSLFRVVPSELSFQGIEHIMRMNSMSELKKNIEDMKDKGASIDEYVELLDQSLEDNDRLIDENKKLSLQVEQLKFVRQYCEENRIVKSAEDVGVCSLNIDLPEFYSGEMSDLLLSALAREKKATPKNARKYNVITHIQEINPKTNQRKEIEEIVEKAFRQDDLNLLKKAGFNLDRSKKHPQLSIPVSDKKMSVPGTPSDRRSIDNTISDVKKTFLL